MELVMQFNYKYFVKCSLVIVPDQIIQDDSLMILIFSDQTIDIFRPKILTNYLKAFG